MNSVAARVPRSAWPADGPSDARRARFVEAGRERTLIRGFALGLIVASAVVVHGHAQAGGAGARTAHLTLNWIDSTRPEPWTPDATDHRGMLIQVYYRAGALESAPLVLFSAGRNEAPKTYTDLADALVRGGYVVAIVDHLGERSGQRLPNGAAVPNLLPRVAPDPKSESFREQDLVFSRSWVELRAEDLTSARFDFQALAAMSGNELSGLLSGQAAALGHSLGGLTAAKACERDPALSACANLDGLSYSVPMHVEGDTMVATQPFLFLGKPIPRLTDATLERAHMTRAQDDEIVARMAHRFDALMQSAKGGSYRIILRDADHMDFAGRGNGAIAKAVREYLMAFLDKHVRGIRGTVLDVATSDTAITVTRYPPSP